MWEWECNIKSQKTGVDVLCFDSSGCENEGFGRSGGVGWNTVGGLIVATDVCNPSLAPLCGGTGPAVTQL